MEPGADNLVTDAVEPRPAATLAVLRDTDRGLEVLLTVRPKELRFMGGAVVFPGGAVEATDPDERWTALREAFEEVGFPPLDPGQLVPAGRWVTPLGAPIRFDTHFFVVEAPTDWEPRPDEREVAGCYWSRASEALTQLASGSIVMAPPTIEMLQRLDAFSSVADAIEGFTTTVGIGSASILSVRLSPAVHLVLAPNPGVMTGPGTNTYIFGSGPTFVIDPAVDDEDYLDTVVSIAGEVSGILITHRHPDHVGGAAALAARTGAPVRAFGNALAGDADVVPIRDGEVLAVGSAALVALHTPGHSSDHLCFHAETTASLFAGDNVLGEGTAVIAPPDGSMQAYMASLERMRALGVDRIFPGHFKPLDGGTAVIDGYIAHRLDREAKIARALTPEPASVEVIVRSAYADTPPGLHAIAAYSARAHLDKLTSEGRAERVDDRWRAADVV
jgi:glyoxylase-like metal-dependent hydrolase (beta-lactamase superfamily II)/8-oxo-dGTP pyrophosphatase MutT (NUDIX family)